MTMRTLKDDKGKVIGVSMNDEPKHRRLKESEIISTHNIEELKRRRAAEAEAAKVVQNEKA
jgi:hypothetical protein